MMRLTASLFLIIGIGLPAVAQERSPDAVSITRSTFAPVPLKVPVEKEKLLNNESASGVSSSSAPLITVGSSLAIVLGLFAALVWVSRKASKNSIGNRELPDDALRVLGKKSMGPSGSIALVRCGPRLLIVGVTPSGFQRLGEINDDAEVRHLEALCTGEAKASFNEALAGMQREPIRRGFIGEDVESTPKVRQKLFG